jgi:hypothetical protein
MKREDDEQLWDLLGRAAEPPVSPFFARNVLRRIREGSRWSQRARTWFSLRRLLPIPAAAALALIAAVIFVHNSAWRQSPSSSEPDLLAKIDPQDYDVVADLDDLLASDENSLWDDDSTSL